MPSNKFSQVFLLVVLAWRLIAIPFEIIAYPLRPKLLKFKALRYSVSSFNISLFHSVDFYPFLQPLISSLQHLMTNSSCTACTAAASSYLIFLQTGQNLCSYVYIPFNSLSPRKSIWFHFKKWRIFLFHLFKL